MASRNKTRKSKNSGFGKFSVKVKHMKVKRELFYNAAIRQELKKELKKELIYILIY